MLRFTKLYVGTLLVVSALSVQASASESFEFGLLAMDDYAAHTFVVKNTSREPLILDDVFASCSCVHIASYPERIDPGASGHVEIMLVPERLGETDVDVIVQFKDPNLEQATFKVQGEIVEGSGRSTASRAVDRMRTLRMKSSDRKSYITLADMLQVSANLEHYELVDVRAASEFEQAHIPSALNIPLHALKTKRFLQKKNIVLVDQGYSNERVESEVAHLRDEGFSSVHILDGGLNAWYRAGRPLVGDPRAIQELAQIPARDFYAMQGYSDWLVIDTSQKPDDATTFILPQRIRVPFDDDKAFAAAVAARVRALKARGVIILNNRGEDYGSMGGALSDLEQPVFYLAGGVRGYEEHLQLLAAMGRSETKTATSQVSKWQNARRGSANAVRSGSQRAKHKKCGSCPG